jgi:hypothetical protein
LQKKGEESPNALEVEQMECKQEDNRQLPRSVHNYEDIKKLTGQHYGWGEGHAEYLQHDK